MNVDEAVDHSKPGALAFDFAKVWLPGQGGVVEDIEAVSREEEQDDTGYWEQHLAKANAEREAAAAKEREQMGRGARKRKEIVSMIELPDAAHKPFIVELRCRRLPDESSEEAPR